MVALEALSLRQAHDPHGGRDRALAGGHPGPGDQDQRVLPDTAGEEWPERGQEA